MPVKSASEMRRYLVPWLAIKGATSGKAGSCYMYKCWCGGGEVCGYPVHDVDEGSREKRFDEWRRVLGRPSWFVIVIFSQVTKKMRESMNVRRNMPNGAARSHLCFDSAAQVA